METPPLPWAFLVASLLIVAGAGVARGYAGFGFSALSVAGLSLLVSPARVVPAIFMLEIVASLSLLRSTVRDVDWGWLSWLALGNALCIPIGIALLDWLPDTLLRLSIGVLLLLAAALLRAGFSLALQPKPGVRLVTGMVSGLVNGLAAIGGVAVALLLSNSRMAPATMRATMIALFLFTDLYALGWAGWLSLGARGHAVLVDADTLRWAVWLVAPMLVGIWVGRRAFSNVSPQRFREHVLNLLSLVATLVVVRSIADLAS